VTDTVTKTITDTVTVVDTLKLPVNLQSGLIAYYPFNGNVSDSTGNGNNGTVYGNLQYATDANNNAGGAALFDGSSSYILVNDNGKLSPDSISICLQFYENSNVHQDLVSKINFADATSPIWGIAPFGGTSANPTSVGFAILGPGIPCGSPEPIMPDNLVYSNDSIHLFQWYQLTCTFENGVEKLYLNGVFESSQHLDFNVAKQCTQAQMEIGAFWQGNPFYFNGKIDELRIYSRALNYREIQTLAKGF
jgi:hypothetical protein